MKAAVARKPVIRIAVVESDPLRFVGFRALFDSEPEFELISAALPEISTLQGIDLILLGNRSGQNLFDVMASLKATRPDLRIIVTGSGIDEETILKAIASGAKGYVDEAATPAEFAQAIRIVNQGSVWAPRRVLSMFIERVSSAPGRIFPAGRVTFTDREKEVLEMLVAGRSNKEIGASAGNRRAHRESARGETDAQGGRAESDCVVGACHYAFAGDGEVGQFELRVVSTEQPNLISQRSDLAAHCSESLRSTYLRNLGRFLQAAAYSPHLPQNLGDGVESGD